MNRHTMVRGRTRPLVFTIYDRRGKPVDLTAATVTVSLFRPEGNFSGETMQWPRLLELSTLVLSGASCTVLDQLTSKGQLEWDPLDDGLATPNGSFDLLPASYLPQFKVVFDGGVFDYAPARFADTVLDVTPRLG